MAEYIIRGTETERRAIEAVIGVSIQEWLQTAYNAKAQKCIERIVTIISDKQPGKMSDEEKLSLINSVQFEPQSEERQAKQLEERIIGS